MTDSVRRPGSAGEPVASRPVSYSIVIATRDRPDPLVRCLQSLEALESPRGGFEVVVVDDGGREPLDALVSPFRRAIPVTLIRQANAGPAAARNAGAARSRGQILVFLDDDCTPTVTWLRRLDERCSAFPGALVGGRTINGLPRNPYASASQRIIDFVYARHNGDPVRASFFASNNMAVPAAMFRDLGGFDTRFRTSEDRELCLRWLGHGERMVYADEAVVHHRHEGGLRDFWRQHYRYGKGAFAFRRGASRLRLERPTFYASLLGSPFKAEPLGRAIRQAFLLGISQAASTLGFGVEGLQEGLGRTRRPASGRGLSTGTALGASPQGPTLARGGDRGGEADPGESRPGPLLHVGFPKTATTALQTHVFLDFPGARSIGKPAATKEVGKALRRLINASEDLSSEDRRTLSQALATPPGSPCPTILSHEGFCATRRTMVDGQRPMRERDFLAHRIAVAGRLRSVCEPGARVLFTVREQCDWLLSLHADLVHREGLGVPFDEWLEAGLKEPRHFLGDPDFHGLIEAYVDLFGERNITVLAFEDIAGNPARFARGLAAAGGLDEAEAQRRLTRLPRLKARADLGRSPRLFLTRNARRNRVRPLWPGVVPRAFPEGLRDRVRDACRDGNRALESRFGVPLTELGYATQS